MFVQRTSEVPAYKVGYCREIRSFVRKNSSRQFKETHSVNFRRDEKEQRRRPLTTAINGNPLLIESTTVPETRNLASGCEEYCGQVTAQKYDRRARQKSENMTLVKRRLEKLLESSPMEVLGAGRVDLFLSYRMKWRFKTIVCMR